MSKSVCFCTEFRFYRSRLGLHEMIDSVNIDIDEEMWYSVTPSGISKDHARRFGDKRNVLLLDMFTGLGGDLLHVAPNVFSIGCEIDTNRILLAKSLYSQLGKSQADFVCCDSINGKSCFRKNSFDIVYLSPPWGYEGVRPRRRAPVFGHRRLSSLTIDGRLVFEKAQELVRNDIVFYLPRGMDAEEIRSLSASPPHVDIHVSYDPDDPEDSCKVRAITAYFSTQ